MSSVDTADGFRNRIPGLIDELLREQTDPRLILRFFRHQKIAGIFDGAEMEEEHAAITRALEKLGVDAWVFADDFPESYTDERVAEQMAIELRRCSLLIEVSSTPTAE